MAFRVIALLVLFCLALAINHARAQQPNDTRYEVIGTWSGHTMHVTGMKAGDRGIKTAIGEVSGPITASHPGEKRFQIGPVEVQWSESTSFEDLTPESLVGGPSIEVTGRIVAPRRLLATSNKPGALFTDASSIRLVGTISGVKKKADGSASFELIGVTALLASDLYRRRIQDRSVLLVGTAREEEDDDTSDWEIEGEYEVKLDYRKNFGWAIDVGGRWESELPARPVFILGYALGSGDKTPERGSDRAFRQTGLQSNDEEFRIYGELLRPELFQSEHSNPGSAVPDLLEKSYRVCLSSLSPTSRRAFLARFTD